MNCTKFGLPSCRPSTRAPPSGSAASADAITIVARPRVARTTLTATRRALMIIFARKAEGATSAPVFPDPRSKCAAQTGPGSSNSRQKFGDVSALFFLSQYVPCLLPLSFAPHGVAALPGRWLVQPLILTLECVGEHGVALRSSRISLSMRRASRRRRCSQATARALPAVNSGRPSSGCRGSRLFSASLRLNRKSPCCFLENRRAAYLLGLLLHAARFATVRLYPPCAFLPGR